MSNVKGWIERNKDNLGATTFAFVCSVLRTAVEADESEATAMPANIREIVETLRRPAHITCSQQEALVAFLDAAFPKPSPQWELDARYLEQSLGREQRSAYSPGEINAIAQRIREANRGK